MRKPHHFSFAGPGARVQAAFIGTPARFALVAALVAAIALASCDETKDARPSARADAPQMIDPMADQPADQPRQVQWTPGGASAQVQAPEPAADASKPGSPARQGWSIVLATFMQPDHRELASKWAQGFSSATSMTDVWVETDDRGSVVRYGSYPSISDKRAQEDLGKIKSLVYQNDQTHRVIPNAYLARIADNPKGRASQYNLVAARKYLPGQDIVYSLQIAVYEAEQDTTREQARQLAEQAVMQLRAQNELAFFYHGPNRSMVCVGVFPASAVDAATGLYSPQVTALQSRYPHNAYNGRELKQRIVTSSGPKMETVPSFLVRVPEY